VNQIVITIQYKKNEDFTDQLFHSIFQSKCHLIDVRLLTPVLGLTLIVFSLKCNWTQLAHLELQLTELQKDYHFTKSIEHLQPTLSPATIVPYNLYMITANTQGIIEDILQFLLGLSVNLHEFLTTFYQAPATQTSMLEITCLAMVPLDKTIHVFRENIIQFCDENNIEVILEPKRH